MTNLFFSLHPRLNLWNDIVSASSNMTTTVFNVLGFYYHNQRRVFVINPAIKWDTSANSPGIGQLYTIFEAELTAIINVLDN